MRDGLMAYDRKLGGWRPGRTYRRRAGSGDELGRAVGADGTAAGYAAGLEACRGAPRQPMARQSSAGSMGQADTAAATNRRCYCPTSPGHALRMASLGRRRDARTDVMADVVLSEPGRPHRSRRP